MDKQTPNPACNVPVKFYTKTVSGKKPGVPKNKATIGKL